MEGGQQKCDTNQVILLMAEILHQLIGGLFIYLFIHVFIYLFIYLILFIYLFIYLLDFIHPRWCRISAINSMIIILIIFGIYDI